MKSVAILMATYNPNMKWLKEQLLSLESQTYKNLKLYVLDDCSPDVSFIDIKNMVKRCIKSFSFEISKNEENLGSCKTFEKLTDIGQGDYFSYCDQDDVWEKVKIEKLIKEIDNKTSIIYADLSIIDENGIKTHNSLRDIRKRLRHLEGYGLAKKILFRNFITGCTMIVPSDIAKKSIPFVDEMIGDHHIALYSASKGKVKYIDEPLVKYRQHESNVTGILKGVKTKEDYIDVRIAPLIRQFKKLKKTFKDDGDMLKTIEKGLIWLDAREKYLRGKMSYLFTIKRYSYLNFKTSLFDLFIPFMPKKIFKKALAKIRGESA
jgi:glycosyltransferase involved in cell wall biosynthesis